MKTTTTEAAPAASTEGTPAGPVPGDFAHLAAEASTLEGGPPLPGTPEAEASEAQALQQTAEELRQALEAARMLVSPLFAWWPEFGRVWGDGTLQGIATNGAAVMQRHGLSMGEVWAKWGPYIGLGMATVPPCVVTYAAVKQRAQQIQQQRQHGQAAPPAPTPAPPPPGASDGS